MIEYDKHDWTSHLFDIEGSMVREIVGRVLICVVWSVAVEALHVFVRPVHIAPTPHTLVGIALGLLLVFRTNASYDRFWEGRRQWGSIINESRNLARVACVYLKGDPALFETVITWAAAFPHAAMKSLRGERGLGPAAGRLPGAEVRAVLAADHVPLAVAIKISECLARARERGRISDFVWMTSEQNVQQFIDYFGACERIQKTPLPYAYVVHLRRSLIIYCLTLPFALVESFGWWTVFATLVVAYTFFGIEEIGVEIENPFGHDFNDLPLEQFCATVERNLFALLDGARDPGGDGLAETLVDSPARSPATEGSH